MFQRLIAAPALFVFALLSAGCAMQMGGPEAATVDATPAGPWVAAQRVVDATDRDRNRGGLRAIASHILDLERELANASTAFDMARDAGYILTDGPTETLAGLIGAAASAKATGAQKSISAIANPYPTISYFLGVYYNEIGKPADALRAMDAGLALPRPAPSADLGASVPVILAERGVALAALARWQESLDNFDRGLKITNLNDDAKAVMLRGRGVALIELNRLDEAETAFRDSLKIQPNNPRAEGELRYITNLRAGGSMAPFSLYTRMP